MLKRYKMEFSFTLPLPDKRYTASLTREVIKRLRPVLGADIQVRTDCYVVRKSRLHADDKEDVAKKPPKEKK